MFFRSILERIEEGKIENAKALMAESFEKQAYGIFNDAYKQTFIPRVLALLKSEAVEEVMDMMKNFQVSK